MANVGVITVKVDASAIEAALDRYASALLALDAEPRPLDAGTVLIGAAVAAASPTRLTRRALLGLAWRGGRA